MLVCIALALGGPVRAQSDTRVYTIEIGTLPLVFALKEFSRQTGMQVGYLPSNEAEENVVVGPLLKGQYTIDEALTALLQPSRMSYQWVNERTIYIAPPAAAPGSTSDGSMVAQDRQRAELSKGQERSLAAGGGLYGSARGPDGLDGRVEVVGSRIWDSLDIDAPVTIIDREKIDRLGVSSVTELLRYVTQQPYMLSESYLGDGTQFVDLRGLGFDTTLVLINGRRTFATASALAVNAFDLNTIPLPAVERIEILSDSTSAVHGADAIGGVFNIVLKGDVPEPTLDFDYGTADGGAVERRASFGMAGTAGLAHGSVILDYFDRGGLLGAERDRWRNQDFRRYGSIDWRSLSASPGNVRSTTGENLLGLPAPFATIPPFASGSELTPEDFFATAGQRNWESLHRYVDVLRLAQRWSVTAQGELSLTEKTSAFGELLYVDRRNSSSIGPPTLASARVPATNPYNPFGEDVLVDLQMHEFGPQTGVRRTEMLRMASGLRGEFRAWDWELSLLKNHDSATRWMENRLDQTRLSAALAASDPQQALNVFGGPLGSPELLESIRSEPRRPSLTNATQAAAYLRGPLLSLPAGPVEAITGVEWREEQVRYVTGGPQGDVSGSHQRTISAGFAEVRVPIIGPEARLPAVHDLAAILSGRIDRYSDVGESFNPQYALIWRPTPDLALRASYAESFRPPPLFDLFMPKVTDIAPFPDPRRNNETSLVTLMAGGTADLEPAHGSSVTAGFMFNPSRIPELRVAANYWRIRMENRIGIPWADRLLDAEALFPERVIRADPTPEDIAAGLPGKLELIDVSRLNYGSVETTGVDFSGSYAFHTPIGRFAPNLSATWIDEYVTTDLQDGPQANRAGVASGQGTILKWRGVAGLGWSHRGFGISASVRHTPSYADADIRRGRNGRSVDASTIVDAQLSLDFDDFLGPRTPLGGFEIRAGVINLFDAEPPFAEVGWYTGFDGSQGDLRQRFGYIKLSKSF